MLLVFAALAGRKSDGLGLRGEGMDLDWVGWVGIQ